MDIAELKGKTLAGRFELHELIGEGGYGAVFRATQLSVNRPCAVKVLAPELVSDDHTVERFRQEARTTSRLTHPNTVVLYDFGHDEEKSILFLVMELLDGKSLSDIVAEEETMQPEEVARIIVQVAGSLQEAHDAGMVHRDVKPHNIMLVSRGGQKRFAKVIDFGISKALQSDKAMKQNLTKTGMMIGTPAYMSPEQIRDESVDASTDQYALATCAYHMLLGRTPFEKGSSLEVASRHLTESPMPLSSYRSDVDVCPEVEAVLLKALAKEPEGRFDSIEAFAAAVKDAVDGNTEGLPKLEDVVDDSVASARNSTGGGGSGASDQSGGAPAAGGPPESGTLAVPRQEWEEGQEEGDQQTGSTRAVTSWRTEDAGAQATKTEQQTPAKATPETADRDSRGSITTKVVGDEGIPKWLYAVVGVAALAFVGSIAAAVAVNMSGGGDGGEAAASDDAGAGSTVTTTGTEEDTAAGEAETADTGTAKAGAGDVAEEDAAADTAEEADADATDDASGSGREGETDVEEGEGAKEESEGGRPEQQARPGRLIVRMIPWGRLFVDGREIERGSRVVTTVSAGAHRVEMKQNGKVVSERTIRMRSGGRVSLEMVAP